VSNAVHSGTPPRGVHKDTDVASGLGHAAMEDKTGTTDVCRSFSVRGVGAALAFLTVEYTMYTWTRLVLTAALIATAAVTVTQTGVTAAATTARDDREVTIPAGTQLRLRLDTSHGSNTSSAEDLVQAHLVNPVMVNGVTVLPRNADVTGHVTVARPSAKVKGRGYLALRFTDVRSDADSYRIATRTWGREARGTKKRDAVKIAVPGAVGGVVGAIVGGKKGAAIGAGAGAGVGTAVVLSTAGENVRLPRGSILLVRLTAPLTVRVSS